MLPFNDDKKNCTGCGACAASCEHLTMLIDDEGFRYPHTDSACNQCGECLRICPMVVGEGSGVRQHPGALDLNDAQSKAYPKVFAAWNKDDAIRKESSSGGVFTLLAQQVVASGGLVIGAAFDKELNLRHCVVDTVAGLAALRGSKYIQSDTGNVFVKVLAAVKQGRAVLFTGTPCQVAGLTSFLECKPQELLTCDLVCHGVPSEKIFRKYIQGLEANTGAKAVAVSFRNKKLGWKRYSVRIDFANGAVCETPMERDNYIRTFISDLCLRPSCYCCPFSTIPRQGDITLADYWGVAAAHPTIDDDHGVSLIFVNSDKGQVAFNNIADLLTIYPSTLSKAVAENPCAVHPVHMKPDREAFMRDSDYLSTTDLVEKYLPFHFKRESFLRKVIHRFRRIIAHS
jgi:coenzyme F420-reducing hydrogenase beta subunit